MEEEEDYEESQNELSSQASKKSKDKEIEIKSTEIPISKSSALSSPEISRKSTKSSSAHTSSNKKGKSKPRKENKNTSSSAKTLSSATSHSKVIVNPKNYISRSMRFDYKIGDNINDYEIEKRICRGGFCDVYLVHNIKDEKKYALKIEPINVHHPTLPHENFVLNELDSSPYYLKKVEYVESKHKAVLVTELLGANLHDIAMSLPEKRLPLSTALRISIEMLRCLEDFHGHGFIHRDVKPSNFIVRPDRSHPVALIDLGLSRYYRDKDGNPYPPRPDTPFVGTIKYASPNVLKGEDASIKDDMISWYYSILELIFGSLPWSGNDSKESVIQEMESTNFEAFSNYIPRQIYSIHKIINQSGRYDKPNYPLITSFLVQAMWENGIKWCHPYCWEEVSDDKFKEISPISMISFWTKDPIEPKDLPEPKIPTNDDDQEQEKVPEKKKREAGCLWI